MIARSKGRITGGTAGRIVHRIHPVPGVKVRLAGSVIRAGRRQQVAIGVQGVPILVVRNAVPLPDPDRMIEAVQVEIVLL
jgi:acyl-coenzyme A thioesterase PaaI-like protein